MKLAVLVLAGLVAAPALAQRATETLTVESFLREAVEDNIADVEIGKMVRNDPAQPQGVHRVGRAVAETAARQNQTLEKLAAQAGVPLSTQPSTQETMVIKRLALMDGTAFTDEYLQFVIDDLERDIRLYERAAALDDPAVKAFAQDSLPALRETRALAQQVWEQQVAERPQEAR
jgi:predicted outer membrane protein